MREKTAKITTKETYLLFMLATFSPAVRLTTVLCAKLGKQAGWVSIILACLIYSGLIMVLSCLFGKGRWRNLYDFYRTTLGRVAGTALNAVYLIWTFVLIGLYVRAFAERFSSSILPSTPTKFFVISLLAMCYVFLSGSISSFARLASTFFYVIFFGLVIMLLTQLSQIELSNFYPVTTLDTGAVLSGMTPFLGIFAYMTFFMYLGDEMEEKEQIKKQGFKSALYLLIANQVIFLVTTGVFGHSLTQKFTLPFFMSVKIISLFGSIERLESVFIIVWAITDIAIVMMLLYVLLHIAKKLFKIENPSMLKNPLILGVFVLAMRFTDSIFEISEFSEKLGLMVNMCLGLAVPVLVMIVAQIRKHFSPRFAREALGEAQAGKQNEPV